MPTPTYTLIDSVTLTSSASSVTFSSITQDYRDLVLIQNAKVLASSDSYRLSINGDTGTNYNTVTMYGYTSASSSSTTNEAGPIYMTARDSLSSTVADSTIIYFMDYSVTDKHKTLLARINNVSNVIQASAHRWASTASITSILLTSNDTFASGSTFSLYGIEA